MSHGPLRLRGERESAAHMNENRTPHFRRAAASSAQGQVHGQIISFSTQPAGRGTMEAICALCIHRGAAIHYIHPLALS